MPAFASVRRRALALSFALVATVFAAGCSGANPTTGAVTTAVDNSTATPLPTTTITAAPTDTPTPEPTPTPTPPPTPTPTPKPTPTPAPTKTPPPAIAYCNSAQVAIAIQAISPGMYWDAGAGSRAAKFVLKNTSSSACVVNAKAQPQLVNGENTILINGAVPPASTLLTVAPLGTLTTMVQTGNLCHAPTIVAPVRVAFVLSLGRARVVATAASSTDTGGVPPCLGDPSVASGSISMWDWAP